MKTICSCTSSLWEKVCMKVNRSIVYIDDNCAELLHWHGGLSRLVQAGATNVQQLSMFEAADESQKKAVFIVSSLLEDITRETIHNVIQASSFQFVIVLTTVSSSVHCFSRSGSLEGDDGALFDKFNDNLLDWMGNMNYTTEVLHIPLFTASISPSLFVTPTHSDMFPLLNSDVKKIELQYNLGKLLKHERRVISDLADVELNLLPKSTQLFYKMLVSSFNGLLEELGVREDCFSIGHTSRIIATELENFPAAKIRRKNNQKRASLIFVDRTLDLASATSSQKETLLDSIITSLPRLSGHRNDAHIDMTDLCFVKRESKNDNVVVPGCIAGADSLQLQMIASSKLKEALVEINRQLIEAASAEKLPIKSTAKPSKITPEVLHSTLNLFRGKYDSMQRHLGSVQVAMASAQTLMHTSKGHTDKVMSIEKSLLQGLGEESIFELLSQLCVVLQTEWSKPEEERIITLDDVLSLLAYLFSLSGGEFDISENDTRQIQDLLVSLVVEEKDNLPPIIKKIVGETITKSIVRAMIEDVFDKLLAISESRNHLKQLSSILKPSDGISPASHKPLVHQIAELIFDPGKPELVDIEYKSSGLKDLLKTGFSLFMNVSKPRPCDHPLLIIYLIGGVTSTEVKQIKDMMSLFKPETQVIIGGTQLVKSEDILRSVFCRNNTNLLDV